MNPSKIKGGRTANIFLSPKRNVVRSSRGRRALVLPDRPHVSCL